MVAVIMCRCAPTDQQDLHPGPAAARAKAAIPDLKDQACTTQKHRSRRYPPDRHDERPGSANPVAGLGVSIGVGEPAARAGPSCAMWPVVLIGALLHRPSLTSGKYSTGVHLSYSAYPSNNSREPTSSSSPFEYSWENSGCVSPVMTMALGAAASSMVALMIVLPRV